MKFDGHDIVSMFDSSDTEAILTTKVPIITRLKHQEMEHRIKKKKARFFEQLCK